jgi:outer membrane protein assembly factor BamB
MTGVSSEKRLPIRWSEQENVRWRVELPGPGNSSPIVWGDHVLISHSMPKENRRTLMCFDRANGKLLWQSGVTYTEPERTHPECNPYCSGSPTTDGKRVYVCFGSAGVYAYDLHGKEAWHRDLGKLDHMFGNAVSPILHGDLCLLNFGPGEAARLVALNRKTGQIVWEAQPPAVDPSEKKQGKRDAPQGQDAIQGDPDGSWSTPIVIRVGTRDELIVSWPYRLAAYDPKTGQLLWWSRGLDGSVFTSPLWGDGVIVALSSGMSGGAAIAVKPGGSGEVTESQRIWRLERVPGRLGSGVIDGGHVYGITEGGIAECLELKTGKQVWFERLQGGSSRNSSWSSLLLADGKIYVPNQSGDVFVLKAGPQFEVMATNSVAEPTNASLAASKGELFLRTAKSLWCFRHTSTH